MPWPPWVLAPLLRREKRVDLDAPDHPAAAIIQGVMVHVPRDQHGVPFPDRILLPITDHHPGPFEHIDLMLPRMEVVSTGLAGLDHRVRHGTGGGVILQRDQPRRRPTWLIHTPVISDDGFHAFTS